MMGFFERVLGTPKIAWTFAFILPILRTPDLYDRILCDHKNVYCIKYSPIMKILYFEESGL